MINKVTLIGYLGRDPEIRRLESGVAVAQFSVATTENYKDNAGNRQIQTEWHNIVAWRTLAEQAERNFKKGSLVFIEGKLTTRKFTDKNGVERTATDIVANVMRLLEKRDSAAQESMPPPANNMVAESQTTSNMSVSTDDDLPF